MKLLLASDLHRDLGAAHRLVERSRHVDVVVIAGDLCTQHKGLAEIVEVLSGITSPTVVVPGNAETDRELREMCFGWNASHELHGDGVEIEGVHFFGLGGGVPVTLFGSWSFDLTEEEAAAKLEHCPHKAVLVTHSPPKGHCDTDASGHSIGSTAILECVKRTSPRLVVCGHVHAAWGTRSNVGATPVINAGPEGVEEELE
jgi:Icc-related predicted phosphoesterase